LNRVYKTKLSDLKPKKKEYICFRDFKGDYKIWVKKNEKILKEAQIENSNSDDEIIIVL